MESRKMMNVYIVVKKTLLIILLEKKKKKKKKNQYEIKNNLKRTEIFKPMKHLSTMIKTTNNQLLRHHSKWGKSFRD